LSLAALGAALALTIPSLGVGEILRVAGFKTSTPPYVQREQDWRRALAAGAIADPAAKFDNLAPDVLVSRLNAAAKANSFRVVSIEFLKPRELAPLIIVSTSAPAQFAAAIPELMKQIDPTSVAAEDRLGWAFEGIFLKALDAAGEPFLVVDNHWRGSHAGGGQWARSEDLLPYGHGGAVTGDSG
jgi:hypothetical protein